MALLRGNFFIKKVFILTRERYNFVSEHYAASTPPRKLSVVGCSMLVLDLQGYYIFLQIASCCNFHLDETQVIGRESF